MGWFGLGGGENKNDGSNLSSDASYTSESAFESGNAANIGASTGSTFDVGGGAAPAQGMGGLGSFEQDLVMEQQKAMVQAVMARLTEMSFEQCVSKPSSSLSSSEKNCIQAVTNKYLDASEFTVARFSQGQQQK